MFCRPSCFSPLSLLSFATRLLSHHLRQAKRENAGLTFVIAELYVAINNSTRRAWDCRALWLKPSVEIIIGRAWSIDDTYTPIPMYVFMAPRTRNSYSLVDHYNVLGVQLNEIEETLRCENHLRVISEL